MYKNKSGFDFYFVKDDNFQYVLRPEFRGKLSTRYLVDKFSEIFGQGFGYVMAVSEDVATSADSVCEVATARLNESGEVSSWYIITKEYVKTNCKRRIKRLPTQSTEKYFNHWVERMIESFRTKTECTTDFKEIYLCEYARYKNFLITYDKDDYEIRIVNLKTGKIGRAKFDGSGMFNLDIGIAIAWARLTNRVVPDFPQTYRKVKLSEMKFGDIFFLGGLGEKCVFISVDSECPYCYIVKKYITDRAYELMTIKDKDDEFLFDMR